MFRILQITTLAMLLTAHIAVASAADVLAGPGGEAGRGKQPGQLRTA